MIRKFYDSFPSGMHGGYSQSKVQKPKENNGWISVEDKPLVTHEGKNWRVNEDVPDEFLAAIELHDNVAGNNYWWIRHCEIIEKALCVYGETSDFEVIDIEFYMEIPKSPVK